ncbi:MAG: polysaccharide deacetylase family protein [Anaerolineae bacterium]
MHYITISWDDGFTRSVAKIAEIYERYGLRAEFNVVVTFHQADPQTFGDFGLWKELHARGHIIQPHGYDHSNLAEMPLAQAQENILRCLEVFRQSLDGFDAHRTVFNFPYNVSTPELDTWLPQVVRAFRVGGETSMPLPTRSTTRLTSPASEDVEEKLERCLEALFAQPDGWLLYTAHGLDGEGWGPLRSKYLEGLLERLLQRDDVHILPTQAVLDTACDR